MKYSLSIMCEVKDLASLCCKYLSWLHSGTKPYHTKPVHEFAFHNFLFVWFSIIWVAYIFISFFPRLRSKMCKLMVTIFKGMSFFILLYYLAYHVSNIVLLQLCSGWVCQDAPCFDIHSVKRFKWFCCPFIVIQHHQRSNAPDEVSCPQ